MDLPSIFWKPLVGTPITLHDLKEIDYSTVESMEAVSKMDKETFEKSIFENFTTSLSDQTKILLIDDGEDTMVTFDLKEKYLNLKLQARLNESKIQIEAIKQGLFTIVPSALLSLLNWRDLRYLVCGSPEIDLVLLQKHTQYRGVKPTDPHIAFFWKVLNEFSPKEKTLFLKFAWGREILPPESLFSEEMKIFPNTKENQDAQLPHADTCFFQHFYTSLF